MRSNNSVWNGCFLVSFAVIWLILIVSLNKFEMNLGWWIETGEAWIIEDAQLADAGPIFSSYDGTSYLFLGNVNQWQEILYVLRFEAMLSVALFFLILTTSARLMYRYYDRLAIRFAWLICGFLIGIALPVPFHDKRVGIVDMGVDLARTAFLVFVFPSRAWTSIGAIKELKRHSPKYMRLVLGAGLLGAGLYISPFILWTQGTIPVYDTARSFALLLTVCSLSAGYMYLKYILPVVPDIAQTPHSLDDEEFFYTDDELEDDVPMDVQTPYPLHNGLENDVSNHVSGRIA